jgi:predicted NUDIX family NTP pyrophosphohydrolase
MPQESAGILLYRRRENRLEVFLVHPGGPFWAKKDIAAWTIPKGEIATGEDPLTCAQRELREETGFSVAGPFVSLGTIRQAGGKVVHAFAAEADVDPAKLVSNEFTLEWPPRSGRNATFPEVDRGAWFPLTDAAVKMNAAQTELLRRLVELAI